MNDGLAGPKVKSARWKRMKASRIGPLQTMVRDA
jgi:hypothetical protein